MRWFKHSKNFRDEPFVVRARAEFELAGYAATCIILEKITGAWEADVLLPELTLPLSDWQALTGFSPKKLQNFLNFCQDDTFLVATVTAKMAHIKAPILLRLMDEYRNKVARKSGQPPDEPRIVSTTDKHLDKEIYKRQNNIIKLTDAQDRQVRKVLRGKGIDPDSRRGDNFYARIEWKGPDNPASYVRGILKKNPNYGTDNGVNAHMERQNKMTHVSENLLQTIEKLKRGNGSS